MNLNLSIANEQSTLSIDDTRLRKAVMAVLTEAEIADAEISLAIVTDEVIHDLNVRYLQHDYPTDVLSFPLGDEGGVLAGEIVVSADTAKSRAEQLTWNPADELLLYVVHGALHLTGWEDKTTAAAEQMRAAEDRILQQFGLVIPREDQLPRNVGETVEIDE